MDQELDAYGRPFLSQKRQRPQLTTDAVIIRERDNKKFVLLITRGHPPFVGRYAFPGGHLDYNEDPAACVVRELKEETNLTALSVELLDVKGDPLRDPRGHYVSIIYKVQVPNDEEPVAGDDAASAKWYDVEELIQKGKDAFAFDHFDILLNALK